jgi:hypothetical protein
MRYRILEVQNMARWLTALLAIFSLGALSSFQVEA